MKKTVVIILCIIFAIFEIGYLILYFCVFDGSISNNINDWQLFYQIANGAIMMLLAIINIGVVYRISVSVENNTKERDIKAKLFEAQSIITHIRINQYESVRDLIKKIQVQVLQEHVNMRDVEELKKNLMGMDNSFFYKNNNIKDPIFLNDLIKSICEDFQKLDDKEKTYNDLANFIKLLEFYIVQQLMRDDDLKKYIRDHKDFVDSTLICMDQMEKDALKMMKENE